LHRYDVASPTRIDTSFSAGEWYFSLHLFFSVPFGICCFLPCSFFLLGEELHCLRHQETLAVRAVLRAKRRDVKAPWPPTRGGEGWSGTGIAICNSVKFHIQGPRIESEASRHPQSTLPLGPTRQRTGTGGFPTAKRLSGPSLHLEFTVPQALTLSQVSILPCIFSLVVGFSLLDISTSLFHN
jgi:hypothetical protein